MELKELNIIIEDGWVDLNEKDSREVSVQLILMETFITGN